MPCRSKATSGARASFRQQELSPVLHSLMFLDNLVELLAEAASLLDRHVHFIEWILENKVGVVRVYLTQHRVKVLGIRLGGHKEFNASERVERLQHKAVGFE
eukprot:scaffold9676_cov113-Isochrysis_galbana.AAC.3